MSWGFDDCELVSAEGDDVGFTNRCQRWKGGCGVGWKSETCKTTVEVVVEGLVADTCFEFQPIVAIGIAATEDVVEMEVGAEEMTGLQVVGLDVFGMSFHSLSFIQPGSMMHASWVASLTT